MFICIAGGRCERVSRKARKRHVGSCYGQSTNRSAFIGCRLHRSETGLFNRESPHFTVGETDLAAQVLCPGGAVTPALMIHDEAGDLPAIERPLRAAVAIARIQFPELLKQFAGGKLAARSDRVTLIHIIRRGRFIAG